MFDDVKSVFASKTVWANILGFLATTPFLAKYLAGIDVSATAEAISALVTAGSFLASTLFRVIATKRIAGA